MKLLTFAHRGEAQHFLQFDNYQLSNFQFEDLFKNDDNYLLLTGEGLQLTHKRMEILLKNIGSEISEVINLGIAGALTDDIELESVHHINRVKKEDENKSFQIQNIKSGLDCISALNRVQDISYKNKLLTVAQIVDRELWAIADNCSRYNLPVSSIKLISDYAGSFVDIKQIIQKAKRYSKKLYDFYTSNMNF